MAEETVAVPKPQMAEMLLALDAANREMNGTARLMGRQHEAIVALSGAIRTWFTAPTEWHEEKAREAAWAVLEQWGTKE